MNTDTGELRQFTEQELDEALARKEPWVPVTPGRARRLEKLAPAERPAVLRKWDARRERRHKRAMARSGR